jgi:hypothetical protein
MRLSGPRSRPTAAQKNLATPGIEGNAYKILLKSLKGRDHIEDVDERMLLILILKN